MTTMIEIEYPITKEFLRISGADQRGNEYRARALALVAQVDKYRAAFRLAEKNERDALRLMLVTRGAMAIMEDCERHQIEQLREWIASNRGKVLGSVGVDALRAIFEIEEAA